MFPIRHVSFLAFPPYAPHCEYSTEANLQITSAVQEAYTTPLSLSVYHRIHNQRTPFLSVNTKGNLRICGEYRKGLLIRTSLSNHNKRIKCITEIDKFNL